MSPPPEAGGEVDETFSGKCPTCGQNDLERVLLACAAALSLPDAPQTFDLRCAFFVGWVEAEVSEGVRTVLELALKAKP